MGDSRKYPYPYMGGILEFQGRGKVSWTGIMNAWQGGEGGAEFAEGKYGKSF